MAAALASFRCASADHIGSCGIPMAGARGTVPFGTRYFAILLRQIVKDVGLAMDDFLKNR